jgi:hypothetical protein
MIDMDTCAPWVNKEDQPAAAQNNRSRIPRSTRKPYKARNWYTAEKDDDSSSSPSQQDQHVATISFTTQQEEIASKAASHVLDTLEQAEESYNHLLRLIPTTLTVEHGKSPNEPACW